MGKQQEGQEYLVRMPQLVAAFVPLVAVWPAIQVSASHQADSTTRWLLPLIGGVMVCMAIVAMVAFGLRTYRFKIQGDELSVGKTHIHAHEIQKIRMRRNMLDVVTPSWKKRINIAFHKRDLGEAAAVLANYAQTHQIPFECK